MSVYGSQQEADAEVIRNLIKELRRYKIMPLLQLADGRVIRVEQFEVVTAEELQADLGRAQEKVSELQSFLPVTPAQPEVPAPSAEPTPEPVAAPEPPADLNAAVPETVEQPPLQ